MAQQSLDECIQDYVLKNDLGTILCRYCEDVIGTLPTNNVKVMYMVCSKVECQCREQLDSIIMEEERTA
ncbi:MAG: GapA-binding peptide SR1P [Paenibacillus sp.]|uniref:SR1 protein n=1 Tax=Paenibacillus aquistagni TaxID=1852522 RepID=A0A1X7IST1_9BACL|nr:GapA-binding peptide SR1P [Paenibacillus aquistagni]MBR2568081.1 GapA-binding peptide SR1P [Paenibacillus sp.]NMM51096.1 GapA-binding peptide SR1P [Paenibacillus aquistagni]SMG18108.1 SR1 protein [Paenibacillus aquistagni]